MLENLIKNAQVGVFTLGQIYAQDLQRNIWVIVTALNDNEVVLAGCDYQGPNAENGVYPHLWMKDGSQGVITEVHEKMVETMTEKFGRLEEIVQLEIQPRNLN